MQENRSTETATPKKRRRWGCLRILLYLFGFCLVAPIITFFIWTTWNALLVKQMVKEIRAKGEPITLDELEKSIKVPNGEVDTTALWRRGFEPLESKEYEAAARIIPFVGKLDDEDLPRLGLPWEGLENAEAFLGEHQASLDAFHEAAHHGGYAAFPPDYSKGALDAYSSWRGIRQASKLLRLELQVHAHRGEVRKAARSLQALLCVSRAIDEEPRVTSQLMACAGDGIAVQALAEVICRLEFTTEELAGFQKLLRSKNPTQGMKTGLTGDRAIHFAMLSDYDLIDPKPPFMPFHSDRLHLLKFMTRHVDAMEMGFPACLEESWRIEEELIAFAGYGQYAPIFWNYSHGLVNIAGAAHRPAAFRIINLAVADLGISVEFYRRQHGKLPQSLNDLVPEFIEKLPKDPHGDAALVYRTTAEGFQIYSIGWPEVDNGGNFLKGRMRDWDIGLEFTVTMHPEPREKKVDESPFSSRLRE